MTITSKNNLFRLTMMAMITLCLMSPVIASAQSNPQENPTAKYIPLEPLPCVPGQGVVCGAANANGEIDFQNYVQYAFNLFIFISAAAAVFMIVWGGFEYMTTESWTGKGNALSKVKNAILGLLLVLTSYLILRTIDPRLVAIPTTLVKPLNINYKDSSNVFMDELVGRLAAENAQFNAERTANFNKNNEIEAQKTALIAQMCVDTDCTPSTVGDYCKQHASDANCVALQSMSNQQNVNSADNITKAARIDIAGLGSGKTCQNIISASKLETCQKDITRQATIYTQSLHKLGQPTRPVVDLAMYENAILALDYKSNLGALSGSWNITEKVNELQSIAGNANIQDPALKAKLDLKLQAAILKVNPEASTNPTP